MVDSIVDAEETLCFTPRFLATTMLKQAWHCSYGLSKTVVDFVELFHLDGLVLGVRSSSSRDIPVLLKVERELLLDFLGVDGGRDFLPSLVEHRQHGVVHIVVEQHDAFLGRADEVGNKGVGVEDLPVEEDPLRWLLAGIKATEDFVDALVGNYLVLLDVFKTLEDGGAMMMLSATSNLNNPNARPSLSRIVPTCPPFFTKLASNSIGLERKSTFGNICPNNSFHCSKSNIDDSICFNS